MGDQADMMLDGTLCSVCGEYMGGDEGYPVTCAGCWDPQGPDAPPPGRTKAELDAHSRRCNEAAKEKRRAKRKRRRVRKTARLKAMQDCTDAIKGLRSYHSSPTVLAWIETIDEHRRDLERLAGLRGE